MAVRVFVSDEGVDIRFDGLDTAATLRRRHHIPAAELVSARVAPAADARRSLGWCLAGTYVPGFATAGRFTFAGSHPGGRQLWCVYRDLDVLVIDTSSPTWPRVVLQHPDRHDLAWWIGERAGGEDR